MYSGDTYLILAPKVSIVALLVIIGQVGSTFSARASRWTAASVSLVIAVLWMSGVFFAIGGGTLPGLIEGPFTYPVNEVVGVVALISAETVFLYALLRPRTLAQSPGRLLLAEVVFLPLLLAFGGVPTDHPGYAYAHERFLLFVNCALLLNIGAVAFKRWVHAQLRSAV